MAHLDNYSLKFPDDPASTIGRAREDIYIIGTSTVMNCQPVSIILRGRCFTNNSWLISLRNNGFWLYWMVIVVLYVCPICILLTCPLSHLIWQWLCKVSLVWIRVSEKTEALGPWWFQRTHCSFIDSMDTFLLLVFPFHSMHHCLIIFLGHITGYAVSCSQSVHRFLGFITFKISFHPESRFFVTQVLYSCLISHLLAGFFTAFH